METAFEIMKYLQAIFGQKFDQSRHEATRTYMITKMKTGVSVREHVLSMINVMHEAEIHGAINDEHTQLEFNMTQQLNELQTFESLNKSISKEAKANVKEEKPLTSDDKTNTRKKNNDKDKTKGKMAP
ncbi:uncharacterized protein LOC133792114 [Humulus lupulus]|uniref:uncharacterized protein LOC133792114 n=1 Tax=Humulus lupulus TaxID=3486 RepID=UPI002B40D9AA|nr:uncharacterized protein LOC133792114 [Humulus lupulus]